MDLQDCEICGAAASFERKNETQPKEGEVCSMCGQWVCDDCVDWTKCHSEHLKDIDMVCKDCGGMIDFLKVD